MLARTIIKHIEKWAPPGAAWEGDNVGLQVGNPQIEVKNIFLCLELNDRGLKEAIRKKCNFIFTHHPFLFKPLKKINTLQDPKSKIIEQLIKNDITLFSAHTNLDFTKEGVSFELANTLKLINTNFLVNEKENQFKLVVFVPQNNLDKVRDELFSSGAGIIGDYEKCSFTLNGVGSFEGNENSNPALGIKNNLENVDEVRLEVLVDSWNLNNVISALKKSHPYEEPAYDIYPLKNVNANFGYGVIGELEKSMNKKEFLSHVCNSLKTQDLRYTEGKSRKIKKVAVCGGSGSDLLSNAISEGADAYVTADVKYHTFQEGEERILFIDAGHYETEIHSLNVVKRKLEKLVKENKESVNVYKFSGSTNPVKFFKNNRRI